MVKDVMVCEMDYSEKEVEFIVNGYQPIIDRIGYFENPRDWAEKIDLAMKENITPDMWMQIL